MTAIRNILVAVKDPAAGAQPAVRKAAQLAAALGARLELFHAIDTPVYVDAFAVAGQSVQQVEKRWREQSLKRLEKHAAKLREYGIDVRTGCEWDFPAYEAIVRRARATKAQMIVAERHAEKHHAPWLLRFNDWELLRQSDVPVLLVKTAPHYDHPSIVAALDPTHSFSKPAKLDTGILDLAEQIAAGLEGTVHAVHAYLPGVIDFGSLDLEQPDLAKRIQEASEAKAKDAFDRLLKGSDLPAAQRHLMAGPPADVIPTYAKRLKARIVVMGAISRSGIRRLLLGNTAERILDQLTCDVLVVKPASFKAPVERRRRGMKLLATPLAT